MAEYKNHYELSILVRRFEKLDDIRTALKEALGPHLSGDLKLNKQNPNMLKTLTYSGVFNSPANQLPQTFVFSKKDVTISYFGKNKNKTKTKNKNKKKKTKKTKTKKNKKNKKGRKKTKKKKEKSNNNQ